VDVIRLNAEMGDPEARLAALVRFGDGPNRPPDDASEREAAK